MRKPSLLDALVPLVTLMVLIGGALLLFGLDALDGPVQVALVLSALVAAMVAMKNGHSWDEVQRAAQGSLASISSSIFILLAVGALIGVWNLSGTIPTLVYYGIELLSPGWYCAAAALICGLIALSIGSSWRSGRTRSASGWWASPPHSRCRRDHGRCGGVGRLPGRQAVAAVGDHGADLADGRR